MRSRKIILTLIAIGGIGIFVGLGLWQCKRAHEKENILKLKSYSETKSIRQFNAKQLLPHKFERIEVKGQFIQPNILLDNQYFDHQWGYHVLSPFKLNSGDIIIVDRGWVKGDVTRKSCPAINFPKLTQINGEVYYPAKKQFTLGKNAELLSQDCIIIETVAKSLIDKILGSGAKYSKTATCRGLSTASMDPADKPREVEVGEPRDVESEVNCSVGILPFILHLNPTSPACYRCVWPAVAMSPIRHYAYAGQWFLGAILVLIYWGYYVFKN